jgi:hypothetical protein
LPIGVYSNVTRKVASGIVRWLAMFGKVSILINVAKFLDSFDLFKPTTSNKKKFYYKSYFF